MEKVKCFICDEEILEEEAVKAPDENFYCKDCFNKYWTQADCGHIVLKDSVYEVNGKTYCEYCFNELEIKCDNCGISLSGKDVYIHNDEHYCEECFGELFVECTHCGTVIEREIAYEYDGEFYCEDCFNEEYAMCHQCGNIVPIDKAFYYEGDEEYYCDDCFSDYFVRCFHCGEMIHERHAYIYDDITLCDSCRENYIECDACGHHIYIDDAHYDEGSYYCDNCWEEIENENRVIHDYNYKPTLEFYGSNNRNDLFLGVELEVDEGGEYEDNAQEIIYIMDDFVYCKHDGSLNNGFEIVSHPATLSYHRQNAYWDEALRKLERMGYKSHDAETCGLHVHMSRRAFGSSEQEQDLNIMKLLYLVEKFWDKIKKFSRRTESQLNKWAARYGLTDSLNELLDTAKYAGRYHAINLQPYYTIEIRIFRGTLKYNTFIATLEFCQYIYDTVMNNDIEKLQQMTWSDFVEAIPEDYKELLSYLEERKLLNPKPQAKKENLYKCPYCGVSSSTSAWNEATYAYFDPPVVPIEEGKPDLYYICPQCKSHVIYQDIIQHDLEEILN